MNARTHRTRRHCCINSRSHSPEAAEEETAAAATAAAATAAATAEATAEATAAAATEVSEHTRGSEILHLLGKR